MTKHISHTSDIVGLNVCGYRDSSTRHPCSWHCNIQFTTHIHNHASQQRESRRWDWV